MFPDFPELRRFLAFWQEKLEGPLHSVQVAHQKQSSRQSCAPSMGYFVCIDHAAATPDCERQEEVPQVVQNAKLHRAKMR